MKLHEKLIYVLQLIEGKVLECGPLAALTVNLHGDPFSGEIMPFQDIFQSIKSVRPCHFSLLSQTLQKEAISLIICRANRSCRVGAIVLIINNGKVSGDFTAKGIVTIYSYVDERICFLKIVFASQIFSVISH